MTKRPRVACPVCELPWRATWHGDLLVVASHELDGKSCPGSGQALAPEAEVLRPAVC